MPWPQPPPLMITRGAARAALGSTRTAARAAIRNLISIRTCTSSPQTTHTDIQIPTEAPERPLGPGRLVGRDRGTSRPFPRVTGGVSLTGPGVAAPQGVVRDHAHEATAYRIFVHRIDEKGCAS